jgi:hypothetical protein
MLKKLADMWSSLSQPPVETVSFDEEAITRTMRNGRIERVRWDRLCEVGIITTDEGPYLDDVFWMLAADDGTGCAVPSSATGCDALLARLQALPGFDNRAVIDAMCSTDNASFVCWRRERRA